MLKGRRVVRLVSFSLYFLAARILWLLWLIATKVVLLVSNGANNPLTSIFHCNKKYKIKLRNGFICHTYHLKLVFKYIYIFTYVCVCVTTYITGNLSIYLSIYRFIIIYCTCDYATNNQWVYKLPHIQTHQLTHTITYTKIQTDRQTHAHAHTHTYTYICSKLK